MLTTEKYSCRLAAAALVRYGVRHVVVSPGSRNAPLIVALARCGKLSLTEVIDERAAAFVALGMAVQSARPVAVVCTSGSAALNLAPALAEAYYRHVPLIALTADRPEEWIDQDDSQTIRQPLGLTAVVKGVFDLPVTRGDAGLERLCRRRMADAMMLAATEPRGPVHVNVQIDEPIEAMFDASSEVFALPAFVPSVRVPAAADIDRLAADISAARRVLVVAGFMPPSQRLRELLAALPANVAVIAELQSNLGPAFPANIDAMLRMPAAAGLLPPDIVITIGGALLSRIVKTALRGADAAMRHWSISPADHCLDPLLHLDCRIDSLPESFFEALLPRLAPSASGYAKAWRRLSAEAAEATAAYATRAPWSDFSAIHLLMGAVPAGTRLHLSNGTAVRYAQLTGCPAAASTECNRGVSGIDGCTSTAVGAAMLSEAPVLLVSGDMSAQYDAAALAVPDVPRSFRMAVLNNGGGGIFRFIRSTRSLPETERWLAADVRLPLRQLAEGYGFDYYECSSADELQHQLPAFFGPSERPAILNIITPACASAEVIKQYFA